MSEEIHGVVCARVEGMESPAVEGSTKIACAFCGDLVWVSPDTRKAIPTLKPICVACVVRKVGFLQRRRT